MQSLIRKLCCSFDPYEIISFCCNASEIKTYEKLGILILKYTSKSRIQTSIGGGGVRDAMAGVGWVGGLSSRRRVFKNPPREFWENYAIWQNPVQT